MPKGYTPSGLIPQQRPKMVKINLNHCAESKDGIHRWKEERRAKAFNIPNTMLITEHCTKCLSVRIKQEKIETELSGK